MQHVTQAPNITDWLQGWGSVAGAGVSALAAAAALGLLWHEIRARRSESRDREAAQARLITVRAAPVRIVNSMFRDIVVTIKNHSSAPIFEIEFGAARSQVEDSCGTLRDEWDQGRKLPYDGS